MHARFHRATRREIMTAMGAGVAGMILSPAMVLASPDMVATEVGKLFGEKKAQPGRIRLELPTIAENGLVVPLSFEVESPMSDTDYVKAVHFFAEGNPNPQIASFRFTPMCPKAAASIRIRLAQTQNVVAYAEMSNGDVFTARKEVKVTIGGCGG